MTITEALVAEHRVFLALFDEIERALPHLGGLAEARLLSRMIEGMLRRHATSEEDLVLMALHRLPQHRQHCDRFHQEHQEIDGGVKRVQSIRRLEDARRLLRAAIHASRAHFAREEKSIFPLIELVTPRSVLLKLGQAWKPPSPPAQAAARFTRRQIGTHRPQGRAR
jgi:hypothetical protein